MGVACAILLDDGHFAGVADRLLHMTESTLLHELVLLSARRTPQARALTFGASHLTYAELGAQVQQFAAGLMGLGLARGERVAI